MRMDLSIEAGLRSITGNNEMMITEAYRFPLLRRALVCLRFLLTAQPSVTMFAQQQLATSTTPQRLSAQDARFPEDLSRRSFRFFCENADPVTGPCCRPRSYRWIAAGCESSEHSQYCLRGLWSHGSLYRRRTTLDQTERRNVRARHGLSGGED